MTSLEAKTSQMKRADQTIDKGMRRRRSQYPGLVWREMKRSKTKVAQKKKAIRKAKILKAVRFREAMQEMYGHMEYCGEMRGSWEELFLGRVR